MANEEKNINTQDRGEMHRIDNERNQGVQLEHRDAELYIVMGIFVVALGLPVILGTYFSMQASNYRPAVVNFICGVVMTGIGIASILYGWAMKKRLLS
ncbi:MAG: hypothetical protein ACP5UA_01360 [Candidatus Hydrogenedens sp.]